MVLVIGGASYIGSHMVKWLLQHGKRCWSWTALKGATAMRWSAASSWKAISAVRDDLDRVFKQRAAECVMHFAAYASVGDSVTNPAAYYENNVVGCYTLLEANASAQDRQVDLLLFRRRVWRAGHGSHP